MNHAHFLNDYADLSSVAAIHDHANYARTIGMGELIVVLNGVEFRTRHNDYKLVMPSTKNRGYGSTEPIPFPEVPPEVINTCTFILTIEAKMLRIFSYV